jgi:hypothetical protein
VFTSGGEVTFAFRRISGQKCPLTIRRLIRGG